MQVVAYLRKTQDAQDVQNQKQAILDFTQTQNMTVTRIIEVIPGNSTRHRKVDQLLEQLSCGDTLITSELSQIASSVSQLIITVDALIRGSIRFIAVHESIDLNSKIDLTGDDSLRAEVIASLLGMLARIEKRLISQRTKQGLAAARAQGKQLGRPKGSLGKSKLDGKQDEIKKYLRLGVSKASIAKITGVTPGTLSYYIRTRGLNERTST